MHPINGRRIFAIGLHQANQPHKPRHGPNACLQVAGRHDQNHPNQPPPNRAHPDGTAPTGALFIRLNVDPHQLLSPH